MSDLNEDQLALLLSAYLDGELDAREVEVVERVLREDESARRLLNELRRTAELVSSLPQHGAPSSIMEEVRLQVERRELLGDVEEPRAVAGGRRSPIMAVLSVAAMLAVVVLGGMWIIRDPVGSGRNARDDVIAMADGDREEGDLREALQAKRESAGKTTLQGKGTRSPAETRRPGVAGKKGGRRRVAREGKTVDQTHSGEAVAFREKRTRPSTQPKGRTETGDPLASASVERKLASGVAPAALRGHSFDSETVRLRITARDEAERVAVTARLASHLGSRRLVDLSGERLPAGRTRAMARGMYLRGTPGVNFTQADETQILVRLPSHELGGLVDAVARATRTTDEVELAAGPLVFRGIENIRETVGRLEGEGQPRAVATASYGRKGPSASKAAIGADPDRLDAFSEPASDGDLFAGLLQAIGLETGLEPSAPGQEGRLARDMATAGRHGVPEDAADAPGGEARDVSAVEEPTSLVDRRSRALEESRGTQATVRQRATPGEGAAVPVPIEPPKETTSGYKALGFEPSEWFVTLVVELRLPGPASDQAGASEGPEGRGKAKAKARQLDIPLSQVLRQLLREWITQEEEQLKGKSTGSK